MALNFGIPAVEVRTNKNLIFNCSLNNENNYSYIIKLVASTDLSTREKCAIA